MFRVPHSRAFLPAAFLVFAVSGFAGLIYESIWSHYLKLFLGHAAYAQTLVLAIFMGGMALGAWLASRWSARWRNLMLAYAVVEALVGLASLAFHDVFVVAQAFAHEQVFPALGAGMAVHVFKWTLAAGLILPQSILLGMTFPLMAGGVLRARPQRPGYVIGMLYFTNSLGAACGVLASGFYLIGAVGLPGTLVAAAILNLMVAGVVLLLPRAPLPAAQAPEPPAAVARDAAFTRLLLVVAFLTGLSSFMYEIGWIRMLALVLGASTHAFELMLSAFILGLALGGLWVRRKIDAVADTVRLLAFVQIAMGIAALATLPTYDATFEVMQWTLGALQRNEAGYAAFNFLSHGIALAVMLPAAICAGMTLPLITASLLRSGTGERAIGQVYAANTVGAIAGVALAVHVAMPLLGLKGLIVAGAAIDLALGAVLLGALPGARRWEATVAAAGALAVVVGSAIFLELDGHKMASGVYRQGTMLSRQAHTLVSHEDGKTATVSVIRTPQALIVRTNGKPDGSVPLGESAALADMATQLLLGALPIYYAPEARRAATIGFGTGVTAHVLLAADRLEVLDVVEIEPAMGRAARHFQPFNRRALSDPRIRIHYDDAKTFFATAGPRYDVIISEPSNPWVSGVASLFSKEFYGDVRRYLREGGLFVQWVQAYETSPVLLASVIEALRHNFTDYAVWAPNDGDLVIVTVNGGRLPAPDRGVLKNPRLAEDLASIGMRTLADLELHRLASRTALEPYFVAFGAPANSDFEPYVDLGAVKARFMREDASELFRLAEFSVPALRLLERGAADSRGAAPPSDIRTGRRRIILLQQALALEAYILRGDPQARDALPAAMLGDAAMLRNFARNCRVEAPPAVLRLALADAAHFINGQLAPDRAAAFWKRLSTPACVAALPAFERGWLRLHAALADGAPAAMVETAQAALDADEELPDRFRAYAVAALMTGRILEGDHVAAARVFGENRLRMRGAPEWQPMFRLLLGHADRPM